MPLFELFRLAKGKLDPSQENEKPTSCPADSTTLPENDFAELTWDNGQFAMQDQCVSRDRKSLPLNSTDSLTPEIFRFSGEDNAKAGKIGNHQGWSHSGLLPPGSSAETDLSQEDDMVPWLHYPISGSSNSDYCSDFLPELPEVTVSEIPVQDNFGSVVKPAQGLPYRGAVFSSLQNGNGLEEGTRTRTSNTQLFSSSSFPPQPQTPFASSQTQLRRADSGPCSNTSSSVVNFSYFARPAAILRSNSESSNRMAGLQLPGVEGLENRDTNAALDITNSINQNPVVSSGVPGKRLVPCGQTAVLQHRVGLRKPEGESSKVPVCARKDDPVILKGDLKEDKFSYESWRLSGTKGGSGDGEKILEPVGGSSSVCSGNSVERASNDLQHGLKRKSQETEESEDHSDDIEDELVSTKKQATTQDSPSRRNRAAEVHNLSERRRRDRINEKMRALQELVPNCNKVSSEIVDKASMLDEVIEYVKTLKLQLQMMTMAGLYMTPMMLSTRMQHMGQVPHFPNMGMGMGMGMGMPHMNMQGGHIPGPFIPNMPAMAGPMYGIHGQGLHLPMPRVPLVPFSAGLVLNSAIGPNNPCGVPASVKNQDPATLPSVKESAISQQPVINTSSGFLKQQPRSQSVAAPSSGQAMNRESGGGVADSASRKDPSLKTGNRHTLGKFMDNGTSMEH